MEQTFFTDVIATDAEEGEYKDLHNEASLNRMNRIAELQTNLDAQEKNCEAKMRNYLKRVTTTTVK